MSDESAYRGQTHPPYCTCVECQGRRSRRAAKGGLIERLLRLVRLKR